MWRLENEVGRRNRLWSALVVKYEIPTQWTVAFLTLRQAVAGAQGFCRVFVSLLQLGDDRLVSEVTFTFLGTTERTAIVKLC